MKKSFDAVAWMRQRRIEIDRETEGLTWEERVRRIRESLKGDPLWERLKDRAVTHPADAALVRSPAVDGMPDTRSGEYRPSLFCSFPSCTWERTCPRSFTS